jgi:hypothetical protein
MAPCELMIKESTGGLKKVNFRAKTSVAEPKHKDSTEYILSINSKSHKTKIGDLPRIAVKFVIDPRMINLDGETITETKSFKKQYVEQLQSRLVKISDAEFRFSTFRPFTQPPHCWISFE